MGDAVVVRYQTRPEAAEENQRLIEEVFAQLSSEDPGGMRYMAVRLADGVTFMHIALMEGDDDPLGSSTAFAAFRKGLGERIVEPPVRTAVTLVGSYRFG